MGGCSGLPKYVYGDFERVDWDYMQSVGGIDIGEPYFDSNTNMLKIPLIHDFSGTRKITVEPTRENATLRCATVDASVSWNVLTTTISLDFWASEPEFMSSPAARGCDEVSVMFLPAMGAITLRKVRVEMRSTRFDYAGHLIGEFSL